jgi:glutathione S-transferase
MTTQVQKFIIEGDKAVNEAMNALEEIFNVNGKKWLCSDFPSIADFLIGAQCTDLMLHGITWGAYPKCSAWRHRMFIETPGFRDVHAEWFREVLPKAIQIQLPMGSPSNLPEID